MFYYDRCICELHRKYETYIKQKSGCKKIHGREDFTHKVQAHSSLCTSEFRVLCMDPVNLIMLNGNCSFGQIHFVYKKGVNTDFFAEIDSSFRRETIKISIFFSL